MSIHTETQNSMMAITDQNFEQQVLKSAMPVIVDFTAEWCPPCKVLAPIFEQVSKEYAGRLLFGKMDIDENPNTYIRFYIQGAPTLIVFSEGKEIGRLVGPHPRRLQSEIERILAQNNLA